MGELYSVYGVSEEKHSWGIVSVNVFLFSVSMVGF